jgi:hypothetical protein
LGNYGQTNCLTIGANTGNVIIGNTGQTAGTGPNLNVNGTINVTSYNYDLINITATNPLNIPTVQTSADGTYNYVEFTGVDTYTFTLNSLITTFNYVLVGPGGQGSGFDAGGGGGGYVQGTSIGNNSSTFGAVIGIGAGLTGSTIHYSTLSVNSVQVARANTGTDGATNGGGVAGSGGTTLVTSGYGVGTTGPNGVYPGGQGGKQGGINFSFGGTTKNYIRGGPAFSGGQFGGGGGSSSTSGVHGGSGVLLVYFPVINAINTIKITPTYIQFPDGRQQTIAPGYQSSVTQTSTLITTSYQNLVSVTIPEGVWIVEGEIKMTINSSSIYSMALSTTSLTPDNHRFINGYIPAAGIQWNAHVTTVFNLTASTTIIYLVGEISAGTSSSNTNSIRYTQIG